MNPLGKIRVIPEIRGKISFCSGVIGQISVIRILSAFSPTTFLEAECRSPNIMESFQEGAKFFHAWPSPHRSSGIATMSMSSKSWFSPAMPQIKA